MKKKNIIGILLLIFLLSISIRLFFGGQVTTFSDTESYFELRQIENIIDEKHPIYVDDLSFSGRVNIFSPVHYYVLSIFHSVFNTDLALKIIINIIASLMVFIVYILTKEITENDIISLSTSLVSVFIPIYTSVTFNSITIIPFVMVLTFTSLYLLLKIDKKNQRYVFWYLLVIFLLIIISPISILFVFSSIIFLTLTKLAGVKIQKSKREVIILTSFFAVWFNFILFKKAFLEQGMYVIWRNLPQKLLTEHFVAYSVPEAIYQIGFVLFLFGLYVIYQNIFSGKNDKIYLLFGFAIATILLLLFKLIQYEVGLIFLAFILVIIFGYFISVLFEFLKKIHLTGYNILIVFIFILLMIFSSVIPTFIEMYLSNKESPNPNDIESYVWLGENAIDNAIILAPEEEGHLVTYFAKMKNVIDSNYLFINDKDERYISVDEIYNTPFKNNAIRLLNKYKVNYITLTNFAKAKYNITELKYLDDNCFKEIYNKNNISIYETYCVVEER